MGTNLNFSSGDWVVHTFYGVGQIKKIEMKTIDGESMKCFRVRTKDGVYWFPKSVGENPRIRPIAKRNVIEQVVRNLRRKATKIDMNKDRMYWRERIKQVKCDGDILSISKLVRDLSSVHVLRKLNQTEENALKLFEERLVREWASIVQQDVENVRPKMEACIEESMAKVDIPPK